MLFKLIKHDFKNIFKDYALLYIIMIVFSIAAPLLMNWSTNSLFWGITNLILLFLIIGSSIMVLVNTVSFIKRRMFSDSAYLNYTLPVSMSQTLISKIFVSISMILLTGLLSVVALIIFTYMFSLTDPSTFAFLNEIAKRVMQFLQEGGTMYVVQLIISYFIEMVPTILTLILSFTLVNTSFFKKKSNVYVLLIFLLISFVLSFSSTMFMHVIGIEMISMDGTVTAILNQNYQLNFIVMNVYQLVVSGILFFTTTYILNNYLEI
ncbi:MAG: hypothetical protein GX778_05460 [Erysipelothrix sp.]|nr:hypothetical protein [Erysipelothrix sp.]